MLIFSENIGQLVFDVGAIALMCALPFFLPVGISAILAVLRLPLLINNVIGS
jgi:hypothetical protein